MFRALCPTTTCAVNLTRSDHTCLHTGLANIQCGVAPKMLQAQKFCGSTRRCWRKRCAGCSGASASVTPVGVPLVFGMFVALTDHKYRSPEGILLQTLRLRFPSVKMGVSPLHHTTVVSTHAAVFFSLGQEPELPMPRHKAATVRSRRCNTHALQEADIGNFMSLSLSCASVLKTQRATPTVAAARFAQATC